MKLTELKLGGSKLKIPGFMVRMGGFVTSPRVFFNVVIHERREPLEPLLYVALFAIAKWGLSGVLITGLAESAMSSFGMTPFAALSEASWLRSLLVYGMILGGTVSELFAWFLWSLLAHAVAKVLKGGGGYMRSLNVLGYAWVADVAVVAALLFSTLFPPLLILCITVLIVSSVWKVVIAGIGLSEAHGFSLSKGLVSAVLPWLIMAAGVIVLTSPWWFLRW